MTIEEAINRTDATKPNAYTKSQKISWLSRVDETIKKQIIDTHKEGEHVIFDGYDDNTDLNTELLAEAPYDELYLRYIEAQIDYANAEYGHYNNSIALFNAAYKAYEKDYNRTHVPIGQRLTVF